MKLIFMKKKFNETKVGQFLGKVAPEIIDVVGDVFPPVKILSALFEGQDVTAEQKTEFTRLLKEYEVKEYELHLQEQKMFLDDVANAREMQKSALAQDDKFSKRFTYYLAAGSLLIGFTYIFIITLCTIPPENQRFADTILGVVIASIIGTIYNFFYGSSKSSWDKNMWRPLK